MKYIQKSILLILLACINLSCGGPSPLHTTTPLPPAVTIPASSSTSIQTVVTPSPTQVSVQAAATASPAPELSPDDWLSRQNPVPGLAWSKDGEILAAASLSGVYVFDTQTNSIIYSLAEAEYLSPLVIDPQGQRLFAGNRVWDLASGQLLYQLPETNLSAASFSPDAKTLVVSSNDGLTLWDSLTGKLQKSLDLGFGGTQLRLAYSTDGSLLYAVSDDHTVERMDLVSEQVVQLFSLPEDSCCTLFSPDIKYMIVNRPSHGSGSKQLWDVERGELIKDLGPCDTDVYLSAFSPDSRFFVIGPCGPHAQLWNTSTRQLIHSFPSHSPSSFYPEWRSAAFSLDGTKIAFGNDIGEVLVWDVNTHELVSTLSIPMSSPVPQK